MNSQITALGARLACEGCGVIVPKLYGRLGGMVTANAEVAEALAAKCNEQLLLQDINTCCEYLNTTERTKRNIHGVVGFGAWAPRWPSVLPASANGCGPRWPTTAKVAAPDQLSNMMSPRLSSGGTRYVGDATDADLLRSAAAQGKRIEIRPIRATRLLPTKPDQRTAEATAQAWDATVAFSQNLFQGT